MKRPISRDKITGPDPGDQGVLFIGWLLRLHCKQPLKRCLIKSKHFGIDLEDFCKKMGIAYIKIDRDVTSKGDGKEYVCMKRTWAQNWTRYYDNYMPHHKEHFSID